MGVDFLNEDGFRLQDEGLELERAERRVAGESNLDIGDAERSQTCDARTGHTRRLKIEHSLETSLEICYG